jgi:hypothetical protein
LTKGIGLAYKDDAHELNDTFPKITGLFKAPLGIYITEIKKVRQVDSFFFFSTLQAMIPAFFYC